MRFKADQKEGDRWHFNIRHTLIACLLTAMALAVRKPALGLYLRTMAHTSYYLTTENLDERTERRDEYFEQLFKLGTIAAVRKQFAVEKIDAVENTCFEEYAPPCIVVSKSRVQVGVITTYTKRAHLDEWIN